MTKEQYLQLKSELKELVKTIRDKKSQRRKACQEFSAFQSYHNFTFNDYYEGRTGESTWLLLCGDYNKLWRSQNNAIDEADKLKREYRLKHVAYCMSRGRTLLQIEPHNHDGNELDIPSLKSTLKKYDIPYPQAENVA